MDPQLRNFKDFLLLYNKITELCFTSCVDNFFNRDVGKNEAQCVEKCVTKFARFNQSMMSVYVEVQTEINNRRLQEIEAASQQAAAAAATSVTSVVPAATPSVAPSAAPAATPDPKQATTEIPTSAVESVNTVTATS